MPPRPAPPKRERRRPSRRAGALLGIAAVVAIWIVSGLVLRLGASGEILPGTSVAGVDLGGLSRNDATDRIRAMSPETVTLAAESGDFEVRAKQAGLELDLEATVDQAYDAGRTGLGAIVGGPAVMFGERETGLAYEEVQTRKLRATIDQISDEVDREPFSGALSTDPNTLEVTTKQPKAGVTVARSQAREVLLDAFEIDRAQVELPVRRRPAPDPAEVSAVKREAEVYLSAPLRIDTFGRPVNFSPGRIARILAIESAAGKGELRLGVEPGKTDNLVASLAERRDRQPRDARLDTPASPPVTLSEQGDLTWSPKPGAAKVIKARSGRQIVRRKSASNVARAVRNGEHLARFPTEKTQPTVRSADAKGATSLIGTFTTAYSCCEPRVTNIQQMAATVDGTVINPGEQFSLNGIVGERTMAKGYKDAPTIGEGNELIDTVGGGVSQFSTTAYNAAYFAGLQIDAHTPHSFYISRYPPGRESTLSFGSIDLLWTNDTGAPVVVRASAGDTSVTVSLYGDSGGRTVKAVTQSRSDNGNGGFDITIMRVVKTGGGNRSTDSFTTSYGTPSE